MIANILIQYVHFNRSIVSMLKLSVSFVAIPFQEMYRFCEKQSTALGLLCALMPTKEKLDQYSLALEKSGAMQFCLK
jgi:hypothetical protein